MGKKNKSNSLGRCLIKDRFSNAQGKKFVSGDKSMLHTTEVQDGYDWGRLNLQSVTEESSFQEFLSTAELAGTEFQAEKLNIKFVNPRNNIGLLSKGQLLKAKELHEEKKELIKIPRRPAWDATTTPQQLEQLERDAFLEWRRSLAILQEDDNILLTPYEKNLEFWRQLWRVVERSDVVVQIVDGRNPLLFRCEDLEKYVKEVSSDKINLILINKADFLTHEQRFQWADYFEKLNVQVIFFSAIQVEEDNESKDTEFDVDNSDEETKSESAEDIAKSIESLQKAVDSTENKLKEVTKDLTNLLESGEASASMNSAKLLTRPELIEFFKQVHTGPKVSKDITTIGLVGYPNVGKSSTINNLLTHKKVSVSATPGKTKHFQTIYLDSDLLLCDCPGLVMPSFVYTKAEMICNGILPVDQMRDHVPPVNLVCHLIPRHVLEDKYGIMIPKPMDGEIEDRPPTTEELLNSYGYNRGFMTANGQPDNPRSARYVLKDYINGKLLHAHAPPGIDQQQYHTWPERQKSTDSDKVLPPRELRVNKPSRLTSDDLDQMFFKKTGVGAHAKGKHGKPIGIPNNGVTPVEQPFDPANPKPWKKLHKHENKNKKEKLRRVYSHLDQH